MSVNGSFFQIRIDLTSYAPETSRPAHADYYLLLENKDRKETSCAFHDKLRLGLRLGSIVAIFFVRNMEWRHFYMNSMSLF